MNILDFVLASLYSFTVSPLELMLLGTLMSWLLYIACLLELYVGLHVSCEDLASVKCMYLEADGELRLIRKDEARDAV